MQNSSEKQHMENNETHLQKPGFWRLLGAYFVDLMILLCLNMIWVWGMGILMDISRQGWLFALLMFGWILIDVGYFAFLEQKGAGTFGKRVFKLHVQPAAAFWKTFLSYTIDGALFVLVGICLYFYMKHDLISHLSAADLEYRKISIVVSIKLIGNIILISAGALLSLPFYFSILESLFGKTLGKKLMGLSVVQNSK